ncbi:MAG: S-layer homology domain-containing protein [Eubacteriales bacterium]|nr:S-layer homology domain-containing protein [Eubacteriales bacterium]MDD3200231.1 S-layer homology domain-containing protein [Eubacteriales bacterium]MDD4121804.1 S-layer homology domain-containing protein [Eubacteriales bacterium]MDD4630491.1 S-layer homology domain-containing protein [Eubacteriales bacterium]
MKNLLLKTIAITLILLLSSTAVFAGAGVPEDAKGQMYEEAVSALMEKGIITGDTDGSFHPDSDLTRAQACIIIVKSMGAPSAEVVGTATQPAAESGFPDMTGYGWAEGYISYAVKHGVTKGYPDGTFKPGNKVTMNEFITMALRAADYSDETLGGTWPLNYTGKAADLQLYKLIPAPLPELATKWMAAQFTHSSLELIEKANPPAEDQALLPETPKGVPDTANMEFDKGRFNLEMTAYNGKELADDVVIYTYGQEKNYKSTMTFTKKVADYRLETVNKYKYTETPAFYRVEDNKIVEMVLPKDVGFTGRAYGVINGTYASKNAEGDTVTGLNTIVAGNEVKWLGEKGLTGIPAKTGANSYLSGIVYELYLVDGEIRSIFKSTESHRGKVFDELSGTAFVGIDSYKNNVVKLANGNLFEIKDNATVYTMDDADRTEYKVGRQANIKSGNEIRIYDMTDDDNEVSGDIVVVLLK